MRRFAPSARFDQGIQDDIRPQREALAVRIDNGARRANIDDTGHYDRSLHTFDDRRGIGAQTDDIAGHVIEWGSIYHAAQAPMRTAATEVGRFEPL